MTVSLVDDGLTAIELISEAIGILDYSDTGSEPHGTLIARVVMTSATAETSSHLP